MWPQHGQDRFLPTRRDSGHLCSAGLNEVDGVRAISLRIDFFSFPKAQYLFAFRDFSKEGHNVGIDGRRCYFRNLFRSRHRRTSTSTGTRTKTHRSNVLDLTITVPTTTMLGPKLCNCAQLPACLRRTLLVSHSSCLGSVT